MCDLTMGKKKLTPKVFGLEFLKLLKALKPHQRSILVDHLNDAAINEIGRFVFNSFKTDLKLKGKAKKKLALQVLPFKRDLNFICNPEKSVAQRRKKIKNQTGSGLGILLATVIPA